MHKPEAGDGTNKVTSDAVYFYTPEFYALDNFSAHIVQIWGQTFNTSEHAYQWKKFEDAQPEIARRILEAPSPGVAKKIATENKSLRREDWSEIKIQVMEELIREKIALHEKVRRTLSETGNRMIYENSKEDSFWGIGEDGNGTNHLGRIWMELRDELRQSGKIA